MIATHTRSPTPRVNAGRAKGSSNASELTIAAAETPADIAALFVAARYRLALPLARTVAVLASFGEVLL